MLKLALILLLAVSTGAVDFTCPTSPISQLTPTGNLPVGATGVLPVPKGTNCTFQFKIPKGYALQFLISGTSTSALDYVQVLDNLGALRTIINMTTVSNVEGWMGNEGAQIRVIGATGGSSFFAKYTYKSLAGFQQNKKNTGDYVALSSIRGNAYYTFVSQNNDAVKATTGLVAGKADTTSQMFAVYSGPDLTTADHMGSLYDVSTSQVPSLGNSLCIVNFYDVSSDAYVMANDAKALDGVKNYAVVMTNLNHGVNMSRTAGAVQTMVTFVCLDCSRFYLKQFIFDTGLSYNNGFVAFQGQTPTHGLDKLIRYPVTTYSTAQMPQLIPTNVFTMTISMSRAVALIYAKDDDDGWKKASDGRKGYVFSPNLWNPAGPFTFDEEFRDNSKLYQFTLNMDRMNFGSNTDTLNLKIGPTSGNPSVDNQYPRDKSSNGKVISNGNYMSLDYRGSASGDIRLSFEMTSTSSVTTPHPPQTTTSGAVATSSMVFSSFLVLLCIKLL